MKNNEVEKKRENLKTKVENSGRTLTEIATAAEHSYSSLRYAVNRATRLSKLEEAEKIIDNGIAKMKSGVANGE